MNITVAGVGGVGGYFGGKLARFNNEAGSPHHISFLARGTHRTEIEQHGLILRTADEGELRCVPDLVTDDAADVPDPDLCLVCVKAYDLPGIIKQLAPRLSPDTVLLPLLNGVDIYSRIRRVTSVGRVLPACVYVGTHIEKPGVVVQSGGACTILFGPQPGGPDDRFDPTPITSLFEHAGIKYEWDNDPYPAIWSKFIFIAAFGLVGAARDKTLDEITTSVELSESVRRIMEEIDRLARASGVSLSPTIVQESYAKASGFPPGTKTSFQRDIERPGKPDERDLFGGTVLRLGAEYGLSVPETERVYQALRDRNPQ